MLTGNVPARVNVETGSGTLRLKQLSACSRQCGDSAVSIVLHRSGPTILIELDGEEHFDLYDTNSRTRQLF